MSKSTRQSVIFEDGFSKPVRATFDTSNLSSDAGLLLLASVDRRNGLTEALCAQMVDPRQAGKVEHSLHDLFRQRVYSIAAGYADGNDATHLRDDPMLKLACDRSAVEGGDLASQPTLSRIERSLSGRTLILIGRQFERERIARFAKHFPSARQVTIDLDATVDPTHGQQAFSFFNGFYDTHCFLPLLGFLSADGARQQFAYHARLRPGTGPAARGVIPLLRRTVAMLRERLPKAKILVRMDGGFVNPHLLEVLDRLRVRYVLGLGSNSVLRRRSTRFLRGLRREVRTTGRAARRFGTLSYAARTWGRQRRVVVKAEVLPPPATGGDGQRKVNLRFVVTNLKSSSPHVYEAVYCDRGDSENRIKELKNDLEMDRTSSTSYLANQFRVLATATAYALYQELQWELRATSLAAAQVGTLRLRLVKLAARVEESVRRFVIHLPLACPNAREWCQVARRLGALSG
jgi:hypothetical protein